MSAGAVASDAWTPRAARDPLRDDRSTGAASDDVPARVASAPMDEHVRRALEGIAAAEAAVRDEHAVVTEEHARLIEALMALPENQDGADKSWLWPTYESIRRHFADARPA